MNLTEISNQDKENYNRYLNRMSKSYERSSKGLIPLFCEGKILDVGCGSGILLEQLENAKGIDLNENSINVCKQKGLNVECIALENINESFDTIIFSSVLHEFSSYATINRYTSIPIYNALSDVYKHLNTDGKIIIRDGVEADYGISTLVAKDDKVIDAIIRYYADAPMFKTNLNINHNTVQAHSNFLKEFMFTYTWGPESYYREVNEKYGILTVDEWKNVVNKAGFKITFLNTFTEEYEGYLSKYFIVDEEFHKILEKSTILIVAEKT